MKKHLSSLVLLITVLFCSYSTQAQEAIPHRCATHELSQVRNLWDADFSKRSDKLFDKVKELSLTPEVKGNDTILRAPVVVHIIHNTPEENLPDETVYSQMEVLNQDYRRLNSNASETREEFLPVAADTGIEFYLANVDPDGFPTNGITRTETDVESFGFDAGGIVEALEICGIDPSALNDPYALFEDPAALLCLLDAFDSLGIDIYELLGGGGALDGMKFEESGGKNAWPTDRYINIWVCDLGGAVLGFAYPPAEAPNWPAGQSGTPETDGIAVHYEVFGKDNPSTPPALSVVGDGRTTVHEMGHYLGLRHIWGDGDCAEDDGLEDTPFAADQSQQACNYSKNTCTDSPIDFPDMIENYMDYSNDACMNMFTEGQAGIMRAMLLGPRSDLLADLELPAPVAAFTSDMEGEILVGTTVEFTDLSTAPTDWFWNFGDGGTSLEQNPSHTYDTPGIYTVSLNVSNSIGTNFEVKESLLTVVEFFTGIEDNTVESLPLYPNPNQTGFVTIDIPEAANNATLRVFDVAGKVITEFQNVNATYTLDLSNQSNGIYFIELTANNAVWTNKLILNR